MSSSHRLTAPAVLAASLACTAVAHADVSSPHPGLTLVQESNRALLVVDLCAKGVSVRATRYDERKKTAQQFGEALGLQAAVNADFFNFPDATYVIGRARGAGEDWPADQQNKENRQYWQFGPALAAIVTDNAIEPLAAATEVVGGHNLIIDKGQSSVYAKPLLDNAYRRTAAGISEDQRTIFLLASNATINAATTVDYLTSMAATAGAPPVWYATMLDGGGSSQMYVQGKGAVISSSRQVANHIGIFADGASAPTHCMPRYAGTLQAQGFPTADEPPLELAEGETEEGFFELLNTGTATWKTATTKLAPIPRDEASPLADESWEAPNRAAFVEADTAPGAVGRFVVRLHGGEPGEYLQYFGLVEEGVVWFADATLGGGPAEDVIAVPVVVAGEASPSGSGGGSAAGGGADADGSGGGVGADADGGDADDGCGCRAAGAGDAGGWRGVLGLMAAAGWIAVRRARRARAVGIAAATRR